MPFYVTTNTSRKIKNLKSSYGTPKWFDAVYNADLDYIKKHAKNINKKDDLGYTALHHAAITGNVEVVSLLLEQGEVVDTRGQDGATPLRCAVQEGHAGVVALLLAKGSCANDVDEDEISLLHCAADAGNEPIARLLLCKAPHLANQQTRSGWTPLHSAAVMGHAHIIQLLIEYSANVRLINNQGKTCSDLAKDRNKTDVLRILERLDQVTASTALHLHQDHHAAAASSNTAALEEPRTAAAAAAGQSANSFLHVRRNDRGSEGSTQSLKGGFRKSVVRRILECPVCLEQMTNKKILQCLNGHNICAECRSKLSICPQCRLEYSDVDVRNRGLEELASTTVS